MRVTPQPASAPAAAVLFIAAGARVVRIVDGAATPLDPRADRAGPFPRPGIVVDGDGYAAPRLRRGTGALRRRGTRLPDNGTGVPARYKRAGTLVTRALDAEIEGCQWHRVELCGAIPQGCSIEVRTTTSALALSEDEVAALDDDAWCTRRLAAGAVTGRWDCLVQSPPGRYLWLALDLARRRPLRRRASSRSTIEFPRISLRRYLPAVFGADPASADFTDRFSAIFDTTLRSHRTRARPRADAVRPAFGTVDAARKGARSTSSRGSRRGSASRSRRNGPSSAAAATSRRRRACIACAARRYGLWRQLLLLLGFDRAYDACLRRAPADALRAAPAQLRAGAAVARAPSRRR